MAGYKPLIDALIQRGYSTAKLTANEKLIADIVAILADSDAVETGMSMIEELRRKLEKAIRAADEKRAEYNNKCNETTKYMKKLRNEQEGFEKEKARYEQMKSELDAALKQLQECETAEARDKVRLLVLFKQSASTVTNADNRALIYSIGNILSGCGTLTVLE